MLPDSYVGLVVADTRRAQQWVAGLRAAGFDAVRVETRGDDVDKGDWQVGVHKSQGSAARGFVSGVLAGDKSLPSAPVLSRSGTVALFGVGAILAAMVAVGVVCN